MHTESPIILFLSASAHNELDSGELIGQELNRLDRCHRDRPRLELEMDWEIVSELYYIYLEVRIKLFLLSKPTVMAMVMIMVKVVIPKDL